MCVIVDEKDGEKEREEEEHKETQRKKNSSRPIGPYEAVCCVLHYLIYIRINRTAKVKAPPHPPLPPFEAGRKGEKKHAEWKNCMKILIKKRKKISLLLLMSGSS